MITIPSRPLLAASAAFVVAAYVFGSALVRALDTTTPDAAAPVVEPVRPDTSSTGDRPLTMDALMLAVENDPFQPDRQRPARRYRLPGDVDPPPPPPPPQPPPPPDFRLRGTAVSDNGGIAVLHIGDAPARVLAVGDYMAGYRLEHVGAGTALMKSDEREITLMVPGPSASGAVAAGPQRPGQRAPDPRAMPGRPGAQNPRDALLQAQMMEALLERAREQGANPQMLQALQRMLEQRGIEGMRDMDVTIQGGSMMIRRSMPPDSMPARPNRPPDP